MKCGLKKKVTLPFAQSIANIKKELSNEGFLVLTEFNMRAILKDALGVEFESYILLGVLNPAFTHRILISQKEAGIFLPIQIAIYEEFGEIWVCSELASDSMGGAENPQLADIAAEMDISIGRAMERV
ncbi:MAG: hypothetical protein ACD_14C00061G0002 [uncultured bacterium]|nr:MAG: hypothetical protein ACD_14C00061G0002 [uncultured bacterium]KKQ45696.1 MAG: hypothetical protein US63_C0012G0031 [Candidatus Moranbacteria bacterium GW2011_GWC2_37_8]KKQ62842.1 MAG: hypothetical protein US82_C0005G0015 [Parcubacteria group bacterium GW2011_GWC1_38_22]KKQ81099.1 MAG: hypothetical protein UT03_C0012G0001 [Candidatus Moranbacteria bacterium GW2011_GWD2_38_7]